PLTLARRLIPPLAFTTRCHGMPGGQCRIAYPTARPDLGQPSSAAICPYVATWPRGMRVTIRYTARWNRVTIEQDRTAARRASSRDHRAPGARRAAPLPALRRDGGREYDPPAGSWRADAR